MAEEGVDLGELAARREEMTSAGRTVVWVAVDGRAAGLIGLADAPRPTSAPASANAVTASMMRQPWPRQTLGSRSALGPTSPSKPPTSC